MNSHLELNLLDFQALLIIPHHDELALIIALWIITARDMQREGIRCSWVKSSFSFEFSFSFKDVCVLT